MWAQLPRALNKAVTLLTYILEVTLLNLDRNTDCFVGRGFPQSYQENAAILPQITTITILLIYQSFLNVDRFLLKMVNQTETC